MKTVGLGSLTGKLQREKEILRELNKSFLMIEIDTLGRSPDYGITSEKITESRQHIGDFATRLLSTLKETSPSIDLEPVIHHIRSDTKPYRDWIEDLERLIETINSDNKISKEELMILEDIISLMDREFANDLKRLYSI